MGRLVPGLAVFLTGDPVLAPAATHAMKTFADSLVVEVALLSVVTGLVPMAGTHRGSARHRPRGRRSGCRRPLHPCPSFRLVRAWMMPRPGAQGHRLVVAPSLATATCLFSTAIRVLKACGPTTRHEPRQPTVACLGRPCRAPLSAGGCRTRHLDVGSRGDRGLRGARALCPPGTPAAGGCAYRRTAAGHTRGDSRGSGRPRSQRRPAATAVGSGAGSAAGRSRSAVRRSRAPERSARSSADAARAAPTQLGAV